MSTKPLPRKRRDDQPNRMLQLMGQGTAVEEPDFSAVKASSPEERERMERAVAHAPVADTTVATPAAPKAAALVAPGAMQEEGWVPGSTYTVPVQMLKDSPYNARVFYSIEEIDETSMSMQRNGQDVAVSGYVDNDGKIVVVDGSKRLRAAKAGGIENLRVEIKRRPESAKELYLMSRRMNVERSTQTAFDDAVRFKTLLDEKVYAGQQELAHDLGVSQSTVSYTLSLNRLPPQLVKVMRDERTKNGEGKLRLLGYASEFAKLFDGSGEESQERVDLSIEIAREILAKDMSVRQTQELIRSRSEPKRQRSTADKIALRYGNGAGTLKVFPTKGQLDLSIKGVDATKLEELRLKIEGLFSAS
jgi:ParB family chromosome partitioning protein